MSTTQPVAALELSPPTGKPADPARLIDSASLMRGADRVLIQHNQDVYCLRVTRQGKLILTK